MYLSFCLSLSLSICGVVPADQGSLARYRAFQVPFLINLPPPHSCIGLTPVFSPTIHNKIFTQAEIIAISELSEVGTVKPVQPYQN